MLKNNKLHLDMKLVCYKTRSMLSELDKLNESMIEKLEKENDINNEILINQLKILSHTIEEFPQIIDQALSSDLKERL